MYGHPTEITVKFKFLHISLKPPVTKNNKSQKKGRRGGGVGGRE